MIEIFFHFDLFYNYKKKEMKKEIILIVLLCLAVFQAHSQDNLDQEYN